MTIESPAGPDLQQAARSAARLSKSLEVALSDLSLSLPQYRLLAFLAGGPERASALAEWLSVSPPSLTALVDGAVGRGLVERVAVQDDRRAVRHVMTDAGEQTLAEADAAVMERLTDLLGHLNQTEGRKVVDGLALVGKAMDAARAAKAADEGAARSGARKSGRAKAPAAEPSRR